MKISQYPDDTSTFLKDISEVPKILYELQECGEVTGLILNESKTNALFLRPNRNVEPNLGGINVTNNCVNCLGVWVGNNVKLCEQSNWNNILFYVPDIESVILAIKGAWVKTNNEQW